MKKSLLLILSIGLSLECSNHRTPQNTTRDFKVVGYLHSYDNLKNDFLQLDFSRVTTINIAFINPDADGKFAEKAVYAEIVREAHKHNVEVFFSLGGGSPPEHLQTLLATREGRKTLVNGIAALLDTYDFDGVDIDLENDLINEHYAPFVYAVSQEVKAKNKTVTAALASWNANKIADSTLASYDLIHVMSYDATGPWNPEKSGQHSPYSMAVNDFHYFTGERNLVPGKIVVGLPFYGYGFKGAPVSMKYRDIIKEFPGSETKDEIETGGGNLYYNGIPTIEKKTRFAKENGAAGVMIWQLLQDSQDDKSLLKAINKTAQTSL